MAEKTSNFAIKMFIAMSLIGSAIMGLLIYLAHWVLLQPTDVAVAASRYNSLSNPVLFINLCLFAINLVLSVWLKAKYNRNIFFVITLFVFVFFANMDFFWLGGAYFKFKEDYKMTHGEFSFSWIIALALALVGAIICAAAYLIGAWLHQRTSKKVSNV